MRITLTLLILSVIVATAAMRTPSPVSVTALAFQGAPAVPSMPMAEPELGSREIDLVKWGFTQGGLTLVLILTLISYRRDFFRKNEMKQAEIEQLRAERRELMAIIDKNAAAVMGQAVALQANTEATRQLAQNVNNLAERRRESH